MRRSLRARAIASLSSRNNSFLHVLQTLPTYVLTHMLDGHVRPRADAYRWSVSNHLRINHALTSAAYSTHTHTHTLISPTSSYTRPRVFPHLCWWRLFSTSSESSIFLHTCLCAVYIHMLWNTTPQTLDYIVKSVPFARSMESSVYSKRCNSRYCWRCTPVNIQGTLITRCS